MRVTTSWSRELEGNYEEDDELGGVGLEAKKINNESR
jgi:hypothetical protein